MQFMSMREFRAQTAAVRRQLEAEGEIILTTNGRPTAILTAVDANHFEAELLAIRRAKARTALDTLRAQTAQAGTADLSMDQIDAEISQARQKSATAVNP